LGEGGDKGGASGYETYSVKKKGKITLCFTSPEKYFCFDFYEVFTLGGKKALIYTTDSDDVNLRLV
jgi:hypothetical protein